MKIKPPSRPKKDESAKFKSAIKPTKQSKPIVKGIIKLKK